MRIRGTAFCLGLAVGCLLPRGVRGGEPAANLIPNGDFEAWEWREFTDSDRKSARQWLAAGHAIEELGVEIRGPMYRAAVGYHGLAGRMVEGKEACHGRSLLLGPGYTEFGLHSIRLAYGPEYTYSIALRGKGTMAFRAWVGGTDLKTGRFKWLGFPDLFRVTLTEEWRTYQGTFRIPDLAQDGFVTASPCGCALVLPKGSQAWVDDFRVSAPIRPDRLAAHMAGQNTEDHHEQQFKGLSGRLAQWAGSAPRSPAGGRGIAPGWSRPSRSALWRPQPAL